jgi:hypothetical protein
MQLSVYVAAFACDCVILVTHMTRRYSTVTTTEQRATASVFSIIGAGYLALIAFMVFTDANPPIVRAAVLTVPAWASFAAALYVWRRKSTYLAVDLDTRRAQFVSNGKTAWTAALDELGLLAIVPVQRIYRRQGGTGTRTEYQVVAGPDAIPICGRWDYPAAKRFAERTAREWRVALKPLDGRLRAAADVDRPLAVSAAALGSASSAAPTTPASVSIERDTSGVTLQSVKGLGAADAPNVLWLVVAGAAALAVMDSSAFLGELNIEGTPLATAGKLAIGAVGLAAVTKFAAEARGWMAVPELRIDGSRVSFRGRSVATAAVTEVVNVLGGRRAIALPPGFSEPRDTPLVVDALHALITEFGSRTPTVR